MPLWTGITCNFLWQNLQSGPVILPERADERQTSVTTIRMQNECLANGIKQNLKKV